MCIVNKGIASLIQKVLNNNNWAILKTARGQKWESAAQLNEKRWFSLEFISWQNYCTECKYLSRSTIGCLGASISKQKAEVTNQRSDWWPKGWENCGRVSPHTTLCLIAHLSFDMYMPCLLSYVNDKEMGKLLHSAQISS